MKTVALDVEIASSYERGRICALGLCVSKIFSLACVVRLQQNMDRAGKKHVALMQESRNNKLRREEA